MASAEPILSSMGFSSAGGVLRIADETGDTPMQWDRNDPEQVAKARAQFDRYTKELRHTAYTVTDNGKRNVVIHDFDPDAERIILMPQFVGG